MTGDNVALWLLMFGDRPVCYRHIRDLFGEEYGSWYINDFIEKGSRPDDADFNEWSFYRLTPKALALHK